MFPNEGVDVSLVRPGSRSNVGDHAITSLRALAWSLETGTMVCLTFHVFGDEVGRMASTFAKAGAEDTSLGFGARRPPAAPD